MANFDEREGHWNTAIEPASSGASKVLKTCLNPILRASVAHLHMKGKSIAKLSEFVLPIVMARARPPIQPRDDGRRGAARHALDGRSSCLSSGADCTRHRVGGEETAGDRCPAASPSREGRSPSESGLSAPRHQRQRERQPMADVAATCSPSSA